ncbi:uncharacterized protein PV09_09630 [Verruconis gallopava]|uniref:Zn(2)-C6 fungal-type domain-containing protein n=1 Tax=Verruconis gallopava TaxID=253628 RepID=A0A0D2AI47_9PEZI|nr:uncharacterized protein PV09_09630 [Verruconis gallopava]KIV98583.1 hypothetical protein PV09_09630 [Verruconis gallopava]
MMRTKEYRGRLSTGCEACRTRRVKCDEARPVCARCLRAGLHEQCRYRDLLEISFRNESVETANKAKKKWRTRAKAFCSKDADFDTVDQEAASQDGGSPSTSIVSSRQSTPSLTVPLRDNIVDAAISRFFFDYVLQDEWDGRPVGIWDYVPRILSHSPTACSLREAMYAVALANFDRRTHFVIEGNKMNMERHYGNALRLVGKEIEDASTSSSEQLLIAVQILGVYEQMSTGGNNPTFMQAHANGLAALLKNHDIPIVENDYRWRMYQSINVQLLTTSLRLGIPSFIPYARLKSFYEESPYSIVHATGLVHKAVDLLALWNAYQSSQFGTARATPDTGDGEEEQTPLLLRLIDMDMAFDAWEDNVPAVATFFTYETSATSAQPKWLQHLMTHPGAPRYSHTYKNLAVIYTWSMWRMTRMRVAHVLLTAGSKVPHADARRYRLTIERMATDACRSILPIFSMRVESKPFAGSIDEVCGFRPYLATLPLSMAKETLRELPPTAERCNTMAWIEDVLAFSIKTFHKNRPAGFMIST